MQHIQLPEIMELYMRCIEAAARVNTAVGATGAQILLVADSLYERTLAKVEEARLAAEQAAETAKTEGKHGRSILGLKK